jgi:hypothetical protein
MGVDESSEHTAHVHARTHARARVCVYFGNAFRLMYLQICKLLQFFNTQELLEEI